MRLLAVLFLATSCAAHDVDHLIKLLSNDDYDIREEATAKLGTLSKNYAEKLYKLSFFVDPETKMRLQRAAFKIVEHRITHRSERWLRLHGSIGIEYVLVYSPQEGHDDQSYMQWCRTRQVVGYLVRWVGIDTQAENKLYPYDEITEIDGEVIREYHQTSLITWGWISAGRVHTLRVRRLVHHEDFNNNHEPGPNEETEEVTVKVRAGYKQPYQVDWRSDYLLVLDLWERFMDEHTAKWDDRKYIEWARKFKTTEP